MLCYTGQPIPLLESSVTNQTQSSRMGFLLAGGKSSRMGANKAFLNFAGQTLLDRALSVLGVACGNVTIVGDPEIFAHYAPVISDVFTGCGPLGGIHSALVHSSAELNFILAVDMPFVPQDLLRFLLRASESTDAIVTVPRTTRGFQPLCAVYRRAFVLAAEQALRTGKYKIDSAFADLPLRVLGEPELAAAGFSENCFFNVNSPEDRVAADRLSSQD
jgi:molybdopterin-guanine dinucleotide biosynthesis protein A